MNPKGKPFAQVLAGLSPAHRALCSAPDVPESMRDAVLDQVYAREPWARDALATVESVRPGTARRYAAAFAFFQGQPGADAGVLDRLQTEAVNLCPF